MITGRAAAGDDGWVVGDESTAGQMFPRPGGPTTLGAVRAQNCCSRRCVGQWPAGMVRSPAYKSIDERGTKGVTPHTAIEELNAIDLAGILN
jgi:hypothetical protein